MEERNSDNGFHVLLSHFIFFRGEFGILPDGLTDVADDHEVNSLFINVQSFRYTIFT